MNAHPDENPEGAKVGTLDADGASVDDGGQFLCSWCGTGTLPASDAAASRPISTGEWIVSHGICSGCREALIAAEAALQE